MAKRVSKEEKAINTIRDLINQMFVIAGHNVTYDDVSGRTDGWYQDWTMTIKQNDEWKKWGVDYLHKNLKYSKFSCKREMDMISLMWGLKFSDMY